VDYQRYKAPRRDGQYPVRTRGRLGGLRKVQRAPSGTEARRGSWSYAGDSVDYGRYKSTKTARVSMESYAGDSIVDYGSTKQTRRNGLGIRGRLYRLWTLQEHIEIEEAVWAHYAKGDSVDYSKYRPADPKNSLDHYAGDSWTMANTKAQTARHWLNGGLRR
jgi:hypothetical protein